MGAWSADSFGNDGALDWLYEFTENPGVEMLRDTLEHALTAESDEYLEAPDSEEAIAAAEIVAALSGKPSDALPVDLRAWLQTAHGLTADAKLKALALSAVKRIVTDSELAELWAESDDGPLWVKTMLELQQRLA